MPAAKMKRNAVALSVALMALTSVSLGVERELNFKPGFNLFSPAQDIAEGQKAAAETDKQLPLLRDPEVLDYVNGLGRRLASYAPNNQGYTFAFKVVNTQDINAFALPGGFIYVNRGTLEAAQDEAQLAGVLAHETGHVVMRHATHQASEMYLMQFPLAILSGALSRGGALSQIVGAVGGFGFQSAMLKNSRGFESQADAVGTYILYHAGYDPHAMAQFFQIIEQKYGNTIQFLSDHPNPGNRIKAVDEEIPQLGPPFNWREDSPQFEQIKKRIQSLPAPPKKPAKPQG